MTGVAADIGHINTKSVVTGYQPDADGLKQALTGAEIVLIPAGVPRKPGMTRDGIVHLFILYLRRSTGMSSNIHRSQTYLTQMPPSSETSRKPSQRVHQTPMSSSSQIPSTVPYPFAPRSSSRKAPITPNASSALQPSMSSAQAASSRNTRTRIPLMRTSRLWEDTLVPRLYPS